MFPVPIVVRSRLSPGRKALLGMLFCLHLFTVVVAIYRVPEILREGGYQATRTMWASAEILVACFAANALTLGTFVRDTGVKKKKFRPYQVGGGEELRSARRDSRGVGVVGKKVSWGERDSDEGRRGDVSGFGGEQGGVKRPAVEGGHSEEGMTRTESVDSLIPRSRFNMSTPDGGGVVKTTTIEVTVSHAAKGGHHGAGERREATALRPAEGLVTASARGRTRGASVPLKELSSLPQLGAGRGGNV